MKQSGMRITLDAAMRARDVSRPPAEDGGPAGPPAPRKPAKGERRRQGKRQARQRMDPPVDRTAAWPSQHPASQAPGRPGQRERRTTAPAPARAMTPPGAPPPAPPAERAGDHGDGDHGNGRAPRDGSGQGGAG
jgi:hypothetical protein